MSVREVSVGEVQRRLAAGEPLTVVDIREPFEWESTGVIPGARLASMRPFLLGGGLAELDRNAEIILVCAHAVRSAEAARYMMKLGFTNVLSMAGGMSVWTGPRVVPAL